MKCVSVYTNSFEQFSDLFETIIDASLEDGEERTFNGITVNGVGDVPDRYVERMKSRPEVVVMKDEDRNVTILQYGDVFDILMSDEETG